MNIYTNPTDFQPLIRRPLNDSKVLNKQVQEIIEQVQQQGDTALQHYTEKFDNARLSNFAVSPTEIEQAASQVPPALKKAIASAKSNIEKFHKAQCIVEEPIETSPGLVCWRKSVAIDSVGLYIPAGSAPLFSTVLMLGIPAKLAGCKEIILCSPPDKNGQINPVILYVAQLVGCTRIFKVGGAQAVAAMAYGTQSIPKVSKIFGPGNQYVTAAKQLVSMQGTAIDMPAGPSELLVWADTAAEAAFVAADLLSQAEHGRDSQVILIVNSTQIVDQVLACIEQQLPVLSSQKTARVALQNSRAIILDSEQRIVDFINLYAPEHLIINTKNAASNAALISNAGSVFLGNFTPESLGDYASGTNHTLPTNGYATAYSGVSIDSFVRKITYQQASRQGLQQIGWAVEAMAAAENLPAHKNAVRIRLNALNNKEA